MSNSLRLPWIKPVILSLLNPLVAAPKPPPLQISDYTSSSPSSSSSSSSSPSSPSTTLILSDARHRIQAHLSTSALSSHSTPLSLLRGAIITLTRYTLSYTLNPHSMAPSSPLQPSDEFVLQVDAFDVVGKGGSGEVGHPFDVMQDREVRDALQRIKHIDVEPRRSVLQQHAHTLSSGLPLVSSLPSRSPSELALRSALPALPAELALHTPVTVAGYLHAYHVPLASQLVLDAMQPLAPQQPEEVEEGELGHSQWSSSKEEEERAVFSQYRPLKQRDITPHTAPTAARPLLHTAATTAASPTSPPAPTTAVLLSSSSSSSPLSSSSSLSLLPRLSSSGFVAPALPRLDGSSLPPLQPAEPLSPVDDDAGFYSTQAPLSFISPPLSPSSVTTPSLEREEQEESKAEMQEASPPLPLSQHNLPLSTFDVAALHEDGEPEPLLMEDEGEAVQAQGEHSEAVYLSQAVPGHDEEAAGGGGDELSIAEQVPNGVVSVDELYLTQAPMMTEEQEPSTPPPSSRRQQQRSSERLDESTLASSASASVSPVLGLSLPSPSEPPSSMPPLSPGTPSPQKSPQRAARKEDGQRRPTEPEQQAQAVEQERSEEKSGGVGVAAVVQEEEKGEAAAATLFTAESIRQRQHQRNRQLLGERRQAQRSSSTLRRARPVSPPSPTVDDGKADAARDGSSASKKQRTVRFADAPAPQPRTAGEVKEEAKKEEENLPQVAVAQSTLTQLTFSEDEVRRLRHEPRAVHAAWSEEDYHLVISYWRSCTSASADGAAEQ